MTADALVGTWKLVSFEVQDEVGNVTQPFGSNPVGFITYTADGHMAVQFGRTDRANLPNDDWLAGADSEIAAAARGYYAYCGTWELGDGEVVHRISLSLIPNWIGGEQVRRLTINGDTITLATPPMKVAGRQQIAILVWQRACNSPGSSIDG